MLEKGTSLWKFNKFIKDLHVKLTLPSPLHKTTNEVRSIEFNGKNK